MKKLWFSARCVFVHPDRVNSPRQLYEERLLLVRARTFRKAMKLAEREAAHRLVAQLPFRGLSRQPGV
jgi:hypothetical protein